MKTKKLVFTLAITLLSAMALTTNTYAQRTALGPVRYKNRPAPVSTGVGPVIVRHNTTVVNNYPVRRYPASHRTWMPPGQAKKVYGTKSAREFAPGQQKKWNGNRDHDGEGDRDHGDHGKGHGKGHDKD